MTSSTQPKPIKPAFSKAQIERWLQAAMEGDLKTLQTFIKKGFPVNLVQNTQGHTTALLNTIKYKQQDCFELLLSHYPKNDQGDPLTSEHDLVMAIAFRCIDMIPHLIHDRATRPDGIQTPQSPHGNALTQAAKADDVDSFRRLLPLSDLSRRTPSHDYTLLMVCAYCDSDPVIVDLLAPHLSLEDFKAVNDRGDTALLIAKKAQNDELYTHLQRIEEALSERQILTDALPSQALKDIDGADSKRPPRAL